MSSWKLTKELITLKGFTDKYRLKLKNMAIVPKKLLKLQKKIEFLKKEQVMKYLFGKKEFVNLIISLNTKEQLYSQGIDSKGKTLGEYSTYTKAIKQKKGQITDHITLKDTGEFYNSFKVKFNSSDSSLQITANPIKEDTNLFKEFGIDIVGLTEDSMSLVTTVALKLIKEKLRSDFK